ncbi:LacI family DNA-binding transcriptional regulator (plasmid) [Rhizobium sp. B230/85]|uniref:LacI family DNA-binding transcriptional regulator n=1 Tax=unclassified Rhizobium TaxID=2613769 RepID=UPI001ADB0286|nr:MULTISPECIES: LacI family DNA-binding transcriptional regulator [unclassified Rhizobium]MBO9136578.1 LacI family DNA-binding transcriptional regulator [Rhizobium sp. B209b/85]QXZ99827.1 LacI family DNA-binding transcriptional regulator [Rhizobium sp. B230/85]
MRPTAKDLAEAAGVSLATVDRVLNGRPNVSKKAVRQVNEAIHRIGFVPNPAAVSLARNKSYRFRFVLPNSGDLYLRELIRRVEELKSALQGDLTYLDYIQIATDDAHGVAKYLSRAEEDDIDGLALMAPESPQVRDAVARLLRRNIKVIQFLSGQEKLATADFVGVDNFAAGATAGKLIGRLSFHRQGKVMVVAERMQSLDSIQRRHGFDSVINQHFPDIRALPSIETHADERRANQIIERVLENNKDIIAVYVLSAEARVPLSAIAAHSDLSNLTVVVHERTIFTEEALRDDRIDAVIAQDPGHAVRSAVRIMRARADAKEPLAAQEKIRIEILLKENL